MKIFNHSNIDFLKQTKITTVFSLFLFFMGVASLIYKKGPMLGLDFTEGKHIQFQINNNSQTDNSYKIDIAQLRNMISENDKLKTSEIVKFGNKENEFVIKSKKTASQSDLSGELAKLFKNYDFKIRKETFVGPKVGYELKIKSLQAISLALFLILLYIFFRFDFNYAIGSVAALIHDVFITLGLFSIFNYEINLTVVAAFLTLVGYSLNDTIVIYDRIRENALNFKRKDFDLAINKSLNQTLSRTVITSLTTLFVLIALYLFGSEVTKLFSFALIFGVCIGTYSSIFVASPVLSFLANRQYKKED